MINAENRLGTLENLEYLEDRLLEAIVSGDLATLKKMIHNTIVYTNESGEVFIGIKRLPINNPNILKIDTIEVLERSIHIYRNVAIVTTHEKRTGEFRHMGFTNEYKLTRTWKNCNNGWKLIAATENLG